MRYKIYCKIAQWLALASVRFYGKAVQAMPYKPVDGSDLDRVGSQYGIIREPGESNASLRQRINQCLMTPGGVVDERR